MVSSLAHDFQIAVDLGREPGTKQPANWAPTGARLGLKLAVRLRDTALPTGTRTEFICGRSANTFEVEPLQPSAHFITSDGTHDVSITGGGWSLAPTRDSPVGGNARWLRFWIEQSGAARNGVVLPAGRLCFSIRVRHASDAQHMMATRNELKRRVQGQRERDVGGDNLSSSRRAITTVGPPPIWRHDDSRQHEDSKSSSYAMLEQQLARLQEQDLRRLRRHAEAARRTDVELVLGGGAHETHALDYTNDVLIERHGFLAIPQRWGLVFWDYPIVGKFTMRRSA